MAFPVREEYERILYELPKKYPEITSSTLKLYTNSPTTCMIRGNILFRNGLELRIFEYLDETDGKLLAYSYTCFADRSASVGTIRNLILKVKN